jgi:carbon monoxide dehydrogenase subunit G
VRRDDRCAANTGYTSPTSTKSASFHDREDSVQLEHSFTVPTGIEDAWKVLLDIERVAPCMPGAALTSVDGDEFTGLVKVKLGPVALTYNGKASFAEKDPTAHRAVIVAQGKDARGSGTAAATVTATLTEAGAAETTVHVLTDLNITGKPAQFGRGVMTDVGNKLIGQFADCLANKLGEGDAEPPSAAAPPVVTSDPVGTSNADVPPPRDGAVNGGTSRATGPRMNAEDVQSIDLLGSAGPALLKQLAPLAGAILLVMTVLGLRRCARRHR